jgi:membrane protein YdbS with pleckstrin-like domain
VPFPRKLLAADEEVIVEAYPNWSVLARPITATLLVIAACVTVIVIWASAPIAVLYIAAVIACVMLGWLGSKVVSWRARLLVITTTRVVYRWGVVHRTGREIPLDRVQDVTYHQTLPERLVGAGSLIIESAGRNGEEPFPDIRHPAEMQSLINQLMSERSGGEPGGGFGHPGPHGGGSGGGRPAPAGGGFGQPGPATREQHEVRPTRRRRDDRLPPWTTPEVAARYSRPPEPDTEEVSPVGGWSAAGQADGGPGAASGPGDAGGRLVGQDLAERLRELERMHESGAVTDADFNRRRREMLGLD